MSCLEALRGYQQTEATCRASHQVCGLSEVPRPTSPPAPSSPCRRNIYLDMGANWCNTLTLFESVPEVAVQRLSHAGVPWHVYAVEAAPLISPYVERCCAALSVGQPLPVPPVPPAGSSMQLLNYAKDLGCDRAGWSRGGRLRCIAEALKGPLDALSRSANPALTSNPALLGQRMQAARTRGCDASVGTDPTDAQSASDGSKRGMRRRRRQVVSASNVPSTGLAAAVGSATDTSPPVAQHTFSLLPAAAGASEGVLRMAGSPLQMLRGGTTAAGSNRQPQFDVPRVDIVRWMQSSFSEEVCAPRPSRPGVCACARSPAAALPSPPRPVMATHYGPP